MRTPRSSPSPRQPRRIDEPQRQPIAVVSALVVHPARKVTYQMNADIADFRLRERRRLAGWWNLGRVEVTATILDACDQRSAIALQLDHDLQPFILGGAVHDDICDGLFEAQLKGGR